MRMGWLSWRAGLRALCLGVLLAGLLGLSGCASVRLIDSWVHTSADAALVPGATYRFERLPSQRGNVQIGALEQQAQAALQELGFRRDDVSARYSLLVEAGAQAFQVDELGRPWPQGSVRGSLMLGSGAHSAWGMGMRWPPPTRYQYELRLLLRDLGTGQVVYETTARHESPWSDASQILPMMVRAALDGFPQPPAPVRRVRMELKP